MIRAALCYVLMGRHILQKGLGARYGLGPNGTMISKEYDQLTYGGFYTDKAYNRMRFEARPGDYQKHIKATTIEQAIELNRSQT